MTNFSQNKSPSVDIYHNKNTDSQNLIIVFFIGLFVVVVLKNAWLGDDAFITFRTVDNFVNGYGLVWNISERVQVYTHPLWMFCLAGGYFFTREIYYTSILWSIVLSLGAILILSFKISSSVTAALFAIITLILSKSFIDYSTSGLENPLTHFLLALFFAIYFNSNFNRRTIFKLSLVGSFIVLNRMDIFLLLLPILAYINFTLRDKKDLYTTITGFLPFVLWECFSLFYYGFLFPNTAYAKLNTGISSNELIKQGLLYLLQSVGADSITLLTIFVAITLTLLTSKLETSRKEKLPVVIGIILYLLYIIKIGGDFMAGRFLTAPLFCAIILLVRHDFSLIKQTYLFLLVSVVIIVGLSNPDSPLLSNVDYKREEATQDKDITITSNSGIADERGWYYSDHTGLLIANRNNRLYLQGAKLYYPLSRSTIGISGFTAGPYKDIIDKNALADPLLARLPAIYQPNWRIGHFLRVVPTGYIASRLTKTNQIQDPDLAKYYDKLTSITQGDLFDPHRWLEILYFNLGMYDHLINIYAYRYPEMKMIKLSETKQKVISDINPQGIELDLEDISHDPFIELGFDCDYYTIIYFQAGQEIGQQAISAPAIQFGNKIFNIAPTPPDIIQHGYNKIMVIPREEGTFTLSNITTLDFNNSELTKAIHLYHFLYYRPKIWHDQAFLDQLIKSIETFPHDSWQDVPLDELIDLQFVHDIRLQNLAQRYLSSRVTQNINLTFVDPAGNSKIRLIGYTAQPVLGQKDGWELSIYFESLNNLPHNYDFSVQAGDSLFNDDTIAPSSTWIPGKIYRGTQIFQVHDSNFVLIFSVDKDQLYLQHTSDSTVHIPISLK